MASQIEDRCRRKRLEMWDGSSWRNRRNAGQRRAYTFATRAAGTYRSGVLRSVMRQRILACAINPCGLMQTAYPGLTERFGVQA